MEKKGLEKLLQLSTSLQTDDSSSNALSRKKLDSSVLDQIMGPDDATLMLQAMQAIETPDMTPEDHEVAFENLEGLVEQIDNANNLEKLSLWHPILKQLEKEDPIYRKNACAVIAAACQNNPKSQEAFLAVRGLEQALTLFRSDPDVDVRRKALFAVTSTLRNNAKASQAFAQMDGWEVFSEYLKEIRDLPMQKRLVFFLQSLYFFEDSTYLDRAKKEAFLPQFETLLRSKEAQQDLDFKEKLEEALSAGRAWRAATS